MASSPTPFPCRSGPAVDVHSVVLNSPFLPNSCRIRGRNIHIFGPNSKIPSKYNAQRLCIVTAQQSSFLKKLNLGFNKENESDSNVPSDGDEDDNPPRERFKFGTFSSKTMEKGSVVLRNQSAPFSFGRLRQQDARTVFVAGATGQFGARISQMLLRAGFIVRAAVPDLLLAQQLAQFATEYKIITAEDAKRLNAVAFDFKDAESIAKSIGNASKAVVAIGPTENGPRSKVTTNDALCVIEAAKLANVRHVVIVYESDGASANDGVLAGISSFFSNLFTGKSELSLTEFIDKIVETEVSYTILKANSTDDFASENGNNLVLSAEGSADINDKVSKSQVASLVAGVFANTSVAENKIIEVATSPSAPSKPVNELLSAIPTDGRREAFAEAQAKAKAEEEAKMAMENARKATELANQLEAEAKMLAEQESRATDLAAKAQAKAKDAASSVDYFVNKAKEFGVDFLGKKSGTQTIMSVASQSPKNLATQITTVKQGIKAAALQPKKVAPKSSEQSPAVNKILGGLFKQETIYVDDY